LPVFHHNIEENISNMDSKIQELTEKLYNEGVEKGREEATNIVENAKKEKERIIKEAHAEAENMIAEATKSAAEMKKNIESELRMYAAQSINALKTEATNLINDKVVSTAVKAAFDDKTFMQQLILKLVSEWSQSERLVVEVADASALKQYFEAHAKEILSKGIEIKQVNGRATSFSIVLEDGAYRVNFGEKEFVDYFKTFLRPQLVELLF
jgi:V/A-type H+-transporting ATPase subunit E